MKKFIIPAIIILAGFTLWYYLRHPLTANAVIRGNKIRVEVAVTAGEKEKGLGFRDSLCADCGMLFAYDHKEVYPFWMKGMRFSLDFIWIKDHVVVDLTKNVPVSRDGAYPIYHPKMAVDQVLEVNAGMVDRWGIQIGDEVKIVF